MEERPSQNSLTMAVATALVTALVGVYGVGYFASERVSYAGSFNINFYERNFPARVLARLYQPMAKFESALTGAHVTACGPGE